MEQINPENLADEHWKWLYPILSIFLNEDSRQTMTLIEYLYKTAFIHGFKHCQESNLDEVLNEQIRNAEILQNHEILNALLIVKQNIASGRYNRKLANSSSPYK